MHRKGGDPFGALLNFIHINAAHFLFHPISQNFFYFFFLYYPISFVDNVNFSLWMQTCRKSVGAEEKMNWKKRTKKVIHVYPQSYSQNSCFCG